MKRITLLLLLLLAFSLPACSSNEHEDQETSCPIPSDFNENDITGTWETGLREIHDTLVIRDDHTYKQFIHVQNPAFDYESDWQPWSLKISHQGVPYLHLEGMRLCVYWEGIDCKESQQSKAEWYDFCRKEWIQMPDEGILLVLGAPKGINLPHPGISLFALQRSTESTTGYEKRLP